MSEKIDILFMAQAIELAEKGRGKTSPNPMVGAVIVRNRSIVGKGYHVKAGSDHAEIIALKDAGEKARSATLYVTMEPCCHHGKTPPCTDAIMASGIKRVVAAMTDDNPLVCGKGMKILSENGIEYKVGVMEKRARKLNESYLKFITSGFPYVTLKLAVTLDGKIADAHGHSAWITGTETRRRVHQWRAWADAVLVGVGTVLVDNPRLTVRDAEGTDPLRIVVDSTLKTPPDAKIFSDNNVLIATTELSDESRRNEFEKRGIEICMVDTQDGRVSLPHLLSILGKKSISNLLCEGGAVLATALIKKKLADKVIVTISPKIIGNGINAINDIGIKNINNAIELKEVEIEHIEHDVIISGYPYYMQDEFC
ncbi:MAG: bifunctional diaminohydroxyphosphoribosylaminopyrimidine deaminase/5-amino-6-(5-phosphoribosylamino)uracil reductase RibD [Candidatus Latescibacteria bacterium]|nr:bifunctional diaminohydroxyphosphoribosylaminopyrimidine deaminase/5-amino-6-(5-phosphoribosylamino)uracil reductase RibD [Candidatus Latescibacterota bacterium]